MQEPRFHVYVLAATLLMVACGPSKPSETPGIAEASSSSGSSSSGGDGTENTKWDGAGARPAATASGNVVAPAREPTGRRADEYDKEATDQVLTRAAKQVKEHCGKATDDNGKASGPFGKVTLAIVLGHNGHTKSLTLPPNFDGKPTGKCVNQAFGNLVFPPWAGADATIEWDIELVQPTK